MLWCDVCTLIKVNAYENQTGNTEYTETKNEVFCNKKEVRQSEYYQAKALGQKPSVMLEIMSYDYNNEEKLEFENKEYRIIRTYIKNNERMELVCQANNIDNEVL